MSRKDVDEIISQLIREGFLNEQRFAGAFAGGKFRLKKWGRIKIKHALKQQQVSDYDIDAALMEIDEGEYLQTLQKLANKKLETLQGENTFNRKKKLQDFLLQKGYEKYLVNDILRALEKKDK